MTAETAPGQAGATRGGLAGPEPAREPRPPGRLDGVVKYGVWLAVVTRILGDRRFLATVITGAIGAYALASMLKNNQARPVRRVAHWYTVRGEVRNLEVRRRARRAAKPGQG